MKSVNRVALVVCGIVAIIIGFFVCREIVNKSNKVEVKFIDNYNHETISTQELEVGEDAEVPNEPKHDGCEFAGWYTEDDVKIESFEDLKEDLVVYAKCVKLSYNVKFYDTIAKKVIDTQKVNYGEDAVAPVVPEHYGYNFIRWKGNYTSVKSNVTVNAIYGAQSAKYVVKYYTIDDDDTETLYTSKTYNSYVNRKVKATIMSIGGYEYDSSNTSNKLSGRVSKDNSLVLKVFYNSRTYTVSINGEEEAEYNYNDEFALPLLQKTVTLTYNENDAVTNKLGSNTVDLKLLGYCKNSETCENPIEADTTINITEDAVFYPVWGMELELVLPEGEGYTENEKTYSFVKWIDSEENEYEASDKLTFTDDLTLRAIYKKDGANSEETVEYYIKTYRDGELYSDVTEHGEVGSQVLGSKYAVEVEGYELNSYTDSIFISENPEENVIEIYYITEGSGESGQEPGTGDNGESGQEPGTGDNGESGQEPGTGDNGESGQEPGTGDNGESGQEPGTGDNGESGQEPGTGDNGESGQEPGTGDNGESGQEPGTGDNGESGQEPGTGDNGESGQEPGTGDNGESGQEPGTGDNGESGQEPGTGDNGESGQEPGTGDNGESGQEPGTGDSAGPGGNTGTGDNANPSGGDNPPSNNDQGGLDNPPSLDNNDEGTE